jgi:acetylornithine deacetylase
MCGCSSTLPFEVQAGTVTVPGLRHSRTVIDAKALIEDLVRFVGCPSVTGQERAVAELFAERADALGLRGEVVELDLEAARSAAGYPGEEAPRSELVGAIATLPGTDPDAPRLAFNAHIDVVNEGAEEWSHGAWSGAREDGFVYGRGSADMKGGLAAALHAVGSLRERPRGDVVVVATPSEEDGGLGTFAALERDDRFAACLIPEPTGFELVCAQAGALTFAGVVHGRAAHAALRLEGESAIDAYVPFHIALQEHERRLNHGVAHPLMRRHELPYPLLVGRVAGGRWSSQVPDRLEFEGRLGVPIGTSPDDARAELDALAAEHGIELTWNGGQFAPAETDHRHPFVRSVAVAAAAELGVEPPLAGVTWGSDLRQWAARGIPAVMLGTGGIERAHGVDERVSEAEVVQLARILGAVAAGFQG